MANWRTLTRLDSYHWKPATFQQRMVGIDRVRCRFMFKHWGKRKGHKVAIYWCPCGKHRFYTLLGRKVRRVH